MNRKKLVLLGVLLWSVWIVGVGCTPTELPAGEYELSVGGQAVNFDQAQTAWKTLAVTTNDPEWKVEVVEPAAQAWLEASANRYEAKVAIKPKTANTEVGVRQATVRVSSTSGNKTVDIAVKQLGYGPALLIDRVTMDIAAAGSLSEGIQVTTNLPYAVVLPSWITEVTPKSKALENKSHTFQIAANDQPLVRSGKIIFRSSDNQHAAEVSATITQLGKGGSIVVTQDTKFTPVSALAVGNEYQPGSEISKSYDGDKTTIYHSRWNGATVMPVTLEYTLPSGATQIDYIVYHTRPGGGNGSFGNVELWANTTTNSTFAKLGDWDFGQGAGAFLMALPGGGIASPKTFRFVVKNGAGGFASCSEMEFYRYGSDNEAQKAAIDKVFASSACMEVKSEATLDQIGQLPGVLQMVAIKLREGTYPQEFRCETYKAYSAPASWSSTNVTRPFSNLDNPTGIEVKKDEKFYVLVGDTWGNPVSLLSVNAVAKTSDGNQFSAPFNSGETFMLRPGINEFTPSANGQLYVQYQVSNLTAASAKPIEIHFPEQNGGYVWGYFNLEKHQTAAELSRIMGLKASSLVAGGPFTIQGKYVQWNFPKSVLTNETSDLIEALKIWDEMIEGHWKLMGIGSEKGQFPTQRNNRQLATSTPDYYMYATDYYVHFNVGTIVDRTSRSKMFVNRDRMWGPAHEFGHQTDRALSWHGYSEASNNLFSNLTTWQYAQKYNTGLKTRGPGVQMLNTYAFDKGLNFMYFPWWQEKADKSYDSDGLFLQLRLTWQLYIYHHILGKDPQFFPDFFALLRQHYNPALKPQERSMQFYQLACEATGSDLTEFFEAWGWFNPIDKDIDQYGVARHTLTPAMVSAAQGAVRAKSYPKALPFQFIEDRAAVDPNEDGNWASSLGQVGIWTAFRDNLQVSSNVRYTKSGDTVTITDGGNAVGFEIREGSATGKVVAIFVRWSFTTTKLTGSNKLYAVQADGARIEITQ